MCKQRLYDAAAPLHDGARDTLYRVLLATLKLFAPILPYVTEEIFLGLFAATEGDRSIHTSRWPDADEALIDERAESAGDVLVDIATAVRRYKSEHSLPLGTEIARLQLATSDPALAETLHAATADIVSVTRGRQVAVDGQLDRDLEIVKGDGAIQIALAR
jgi:valyl-tRNA synthetase